MMRFEGKTALIVGGTSGIGRGTALAFAAEGAKVVVAGRREPEGMEVVDAITKAGGEAMFVRTDVTKASDVKALVDRTVETYGGLDCAFNNAGIEGVPGILHEVEEHVADELFAVNIKGVWLSMKYEIPALLARGGGTIVNMSSILGLAALPVISLYAASKHAVLGMTKANALAYANHGIRVNAVCPTAIAGTPIVDRADPEAMQAIAMANPISRFGRIEEVAEAVLWLSSDASSFTTGHALPVDGGYLCR